MMDLFNSNGHGNQNYDVTEGPPPVFLQRPLTEHISNRYDEYAQRELDRLDLNEAFFQDPEAALLNSDLSAADYVARIGLVDNAEDSVNNANTLFRETSRKAALDISVAAIYGGLFPRFAAVVACYLFAMLWWYNYNVKVNPSETEDEEEGNSSETESDSKIPGAGPSEESQITSSHQTTSSSSRQGKCQVQVDSDLGERLHMLIFPLMGLMLSIAPSVYASIVRDGDSSDVTASLAQSESLILPNSESFGRNRISDHFLKMAVNPMTFQILFLLTLIVIVVVIGYFSRSLSAAGDFFVFSFCDMAICFMGWSLLIPSVRNNVKIISRDQDLLRGLISIFGFVLLAPQISQSGSMAKDRLSSAVLILIFVYEIGLLLELFQLEHTIPIFSIKFRFLMTVLVSVFRHTDSSKKTYKKISVFLLQFLPVLVLEKNGLIQAIPGIPSLIQAIPGIPSMIKRVTVSVFTTILQNARSDPIGFGCLVCVPLFLVIFLLWTKLGLASNLGVAWGFLASKLVVSLVGYFSCLSFLVYTVTVKHVVDIGHLEPWFSEQDSDIRNRKHYKYLTEAIRCWVL